ncbi:MAG: efflux RND transporter periplasmic adaptor subunit [Paracoccus sp. (in: a-proteobacteria)]
MIRLPLLGLAALSVLALPAFAFDLPWSKDEAEAVLVPPRPVVSVLMEDLPSERRAFPGVVVARSEVQLGFQTLGRLSSRPVDVGDRAQTGEVLAELTPDDLQDNVRAANAAVDTAEVTLETAQTTATRARDLARRNVASRAQLEQAERALKLAEAGLAQARSELARAEDAEGFARLVAPFDGVVSAVFENPGAVVGAGTPVLTLSDTNLREAVIDLPEAAVPGMPADVEAEIWLESDPGTRTTGRVSRLDPLADSATRTRRLYLTMDDAETFRLNALIRVRRAGQAGLVLILPRAALAGSEAEPAVWVVKRDGDKASVTLRKVSVGPDLMNATVEIEAGLEPGEEVVIRGVHSLQEGQPVGRRVAP